ncbi:MAG: pitrilysin family protein [Pyrinomonadaceae bacterium]
MSEEFRKFPPTQLPSIGFDIPPASRFVLDNGLRVIVLEDRRFPMISLRLGFLRGEINDSGDTNGVMSAMASQMTEGTSTHSSREIAELVDSVGGDLSVGAGYDNTVMRISSLTKHFPKMLDLGAEVLLDPIFPESELDLYRQNAIEGLKYQRSQPDFLAEEHLGKLIYGGHPYGINSPSEDDFRNLSREHLLDAYKRTIIPSNAVLVAVGDISANELGMELNARFGGWEKADVSDSSFPEIPNRSKRSMVIVDRPGSTQSNIVLSNLAMKRLNGDYFKFLVMNQVLGAGASSRLFMNLREEKGYTYGAYSRIYARRFAGNFEATSEVRTSVTGDALKEFFFELERIREESVPEQELADAINYLSGVFPIKAETQGALLGLLTSQELHGLPEDYLLTYRDNVRGVSVADVQEAARKYVRPDEMAIVIVGDAREVLAQVEAYCDDISIFNTEGEQMPVDDFVVVEGEPPAEFAGTYDLTVDAQGQELPLTLTLTQEGETASGNMDSAFGEGKLKTGIIQGKRISATIESEFQGQPFELTMNAAIENGELKGSLVIPMMGDPLQFKGARREA